MNWPSAVNGEELDPYSLLEDLLSDTSLSVWNELLEIAGTSAPMSNLKVKVCEPTATWTVHEFCWLSVIVSRYM